MIRNLSWIFFLSDILTVANFKGIVRIYKIDKAWDGKRVFSKAMHYI